MGKLTFTTAQIQTKLDIVTVPNQTNFVGTIYLGNENGGIALDNTGTDAGDFNTYVGKVSGNSSTIAKNNTALGYNALKSATSGWANTAIGYNALSTGIGTGSLDISGDGIEFYANTAIGEGSMGVATTASYNTAVGTNSLTKLTTGINNTAIGVHSLNENIVGNYNVAVGRNSLYNNVTNACTAVGYSAGNAHAGTGQISAFGYQSGLKNNNNGANTYFGYQAGVENVAGYENTFIGHQAGISSIGKNQYFNTVIGHLAGFAAGNNEGNTYIGARSGYVKTTGDNNTFIGYKSGQNVSQLVTAANSYAIGYDAYTTVSNTGVIGNASVTDVYFGSVSAATVLHASKYMVSALNTAPAAATSEGTMGDIRFTATGIFICTVTGTEGNATWLKATIATF